MFDIPICPSRPIVHHLPTLFQAQDSTLYGLHRGLCAPLSSFWIRLTEGSSRRLERGRTVKSGYLLLQLPPCGLPLVNAVSDPPIKPFSASPLPLGHGLKGGLIKPCPPPKMLAGP